jgi:Glycosyl hydrolase family 12
MSGPWSTTNDGEGGRPARRRGGRHRRCDTAIRFRPEAWRALVGGLGLVALVIVSGAAPQSSATTTGLVPAAVSTPTTTTTTPTTSPTTTTPTTTTKASTTTKAPATSKAPAANEKKVCDKFGSTPVQGGRYEVQNDLWGASTPQCIYAFDTGFRVEANHNKDSGPASYPSIVFGCNYGNCTKGTPFPRPISDLGDLRTSWTTTTPAKGDYNVSYDIWLDPTARKTGRPTGLELMIWLKHTDRVNPIGKQVGETTLDGVPYEVWQGKADVTTISYVRKQPTNAVANLSIPTFVTDATKRGVAKPNWYMTSVQAGFEPWIGGTGLATTNFSVTRNGQ